MADDCTRNSRRKLQVEQTGSTLRVSISPMQEGENGGRIRSRLRAILLHFNLSVSGRWPFVSLRHPYRGRRQMLRAIGPHLNVSTPWVATDPPVGGELAALFKSTSNVHKWPHYFPVYESVLAPLKARPINLLEIGVFRGGSLRMWRKYLHPDSTIVGIDIDPSCDQYNDPEQQIFVKIGSQEDAAFLQDVVAEFGRFDVVIDDGSHRNGHIIDSFRYLFANGLTDNGAYIVEDLHANYWLDWRDRAMSFIDFSKLLIDAMHAHYQEAGSEQEFRVGDPQRLKEVSVPIASKLVQKVEFYDSIAVIYRGSRDLPCSIRNY